jgi:hypothetical protein
LQKFRLAFCEKLGFRFFPTKIRRFSITEKEVSRRYGLIIEDLTAPVEAELGEKIAKIDEDLLVQLTVCNPNSRKKAFRAGEERLGRPAGGRFYKSLGSVSS